MPTEVVESIEVGVGRDQRAIVLDGDGCVLGVSHELAVGVGCSAQPLPDCQVVGAG